MTPSIWAEDAASGLLRLMRREAKKKPHRVVWLFLFGSPCWEADATSSLTVEEPLVLSSNQRQPVLPADAARGLLRKLPYGKICTCRGKAATACHYASNPPKKSEIRKSRSLTCSFLFGPPAGKQTRLRRLLRKNLWFFHRTQRCRRHYVAYCATSLREDCPVAAKPQQLVTMPRTQHRTTSERKKQVIDLLFSFVRLQDKITTSKFVPLCT